MRTRVVCRLLAVLIFVPLVSSAGLASQPVRFDLAEMQAAFSGAQTVDLRTSKVSSVSKLRDLVGIPPPSTPILVKTFKRDLLPDVLKPAFARPGVVGVTINGSYIAIIHTDLSNEYEDVLRHELVHAYITLASPHPLPFWFQEGSAVHFSMNKSRKFYGQPSKDDPRLMVGKVVELDDTYKQKLQSFHFLIDKVGERKFYKWYKNAVETGVVDARPLVGLDEEQPRPTAPRKRFPLWLAGLAGAIVAIVGVAAYVSMRRSDDEW